MLIKPSDVYDVAKDALQFVQKEDISKTDKKVILEMCRDYYQEKNQYVVDQWLAQFLQRLIDKNFPPTSLE